MFDIISKVALEILLDIHNHIKLYSHEFDDFYSEEYKNSEIREVLKEEHLRVIFFEKLKKKLINNFTESSNHITRWSKIIAEKEYKNKRRNKCDIFLKGQIIRKYQENYAYKKDFQKNAWIELKFFTPTDDAPANNSIKLVKDILRLLFLADDFIITERYLIVFILCGKYQNRKKTLREYFLKIKQFQELLFPAQLNIPKSFTMNIGEFIKKCNNQSKNFSNNIKEFEEKLNKVDLLYFERCILSPFKNFAKERSYDKFNKSLFGYVFKLNGYRPKK